MSSGDLVPEHRKSLRLDYHLPNYEEHLYAAPLSNLGENTSPCPYLENLITKLAISLMSPSKKSFLSSTFSLKESSLDNNTNASKYDDQI